MSSLSSVVTKNTYNNFEKIRPYNDEEFSSVIDKLCNNDELIAAVARQRFGKWNRALKWISHPIIKWSLKPQLKLINNVEILQNKVGRYIKRMLNNTSDGLTVDGLDRLEKGEVYLFISNHRDIVLDAAMVNYSLHGVGMKTCRVATGDNLLSKTYVADLMRLNKSFIVNRSTTAPREMLVNFKTLSAYISHSLLIDKNHIWIAQAEGRAKNGIDRTQAAIVKMIAMNRDKKTESIGSYLQKLNIVPVTVNYEIDPNDAAKGKELYIINKYGKYKKDKYEDVDSITRGITEHKGKVHLSFGTPLNEIYEDVNDIVQEIDRQIISMQHLYVSNYHAYFMINKRYPKAWDSFKTSLTPQQLNQKINSFEKRIDAIPEKHRSFVLSIYANVFEVKEELGLL